MADPARTRVTEILTDLGETQDISKFEQLLPLVYDELRTMADRLMRRERRDHTLQTTALVHEAYLKLVDQARVRWQGSTHFRAVAAQAMRRILVDHARAKKREKRGGGWERVSLAQALSPAGSDLDADQLLALHSAVEKLAELDQRQARVVEMRFFGGLSVAETAEALDMSSRTVEGDWAHARVWLRRELDRP